MADKSLLRNMTRKEIAEQSYMIPKFEYLQIVKKEYLWKKSIAKYGQKLCIDYK